MSQDLHAPGLAARFPRDRRQGHRRLVGRGGISRHRAGVGLRRAAPSNRINVGAIGNGRISRGHDLPGLWKHDAARIMAVCDVDSQRVEDARTLVNGHYTKKAGKPYDGVRVYGDYRELLANADIDAVVISTPDHWHAIIAIDAVEAGKDVYLQKPASLTIAEGQAPEQRRPSHRPDLPDRQPATLVAAVPLCGGTGAQRAHRPAARPWKWGCPAIPSGDDEPTMPVPKNLNYDRWLGSTPVVPYTEKRVHPQTGYDRPGWLRCEQFGAGMITGWGAHHLDIAHWGDEHGVHGPGGSVGHGGVSDEGALGRPRPVQDRGAVRRRRPDDRQR